VRELVRAARERDHRETRAGPPFRVDDEAAGGPLQRRIRRAHTRASGHGIDRSRVERVGAARCADYCVFVLRVEGGGRLGRDRVLLRRREGVAEVPGAAAFEPEEAERDRTAMRG